MISNFVKGYRPCMCHKKMKNLPWRACRNVMPTKENYVRHTIIEDPRCDRFLYTSKNPFHALWSCKELDIVWADLKLWGFQSSDQFQNFREAPSWIIGNGQHPELFPTTVRIIWSQQNNARLHKPT